MLTEACLEPIRKSTMELFSLRLSHILKKPQTISIYWFYLLHNYVIMSTKLKQFVTHIFVWPWTAVYFSQVVSFIQLT